MRNNLILLALIFVGLGVWFFFLSGRDKSSVDPADISFAIQDTSAIYTIHLSYFEQGSLTRSLALLRTKEGGWSLNDQFTVFQPRINQLLRVMHLIRVKELLAPKGQQTAESLLDRSHLHVEAFDRDGKTIRAYDIGSSAKNGQGNVMKLAGADMPVVVELPGLQGFVSNYYSLEPLFWRENLLFDGRLDSLQSVSIDYQDGRTGFSLQRNLNGIDWEFAYDKRKPGGRALQRYLDNFTTKVYAESFAFENYPGLYDDLARRNPDIRLRIRYRSGEEVLLNLYERTDNPNNYFGWLDGPNELLTIQHYVIDKYLVQLEDLLGQPL